MWKSAGLVGVLVCAAVLVGCAAEKERPAREASLSERPSRDTAVSVPTPAAAGTDAVTKGREIYNDNCGSCHRAGSYDQQGKLDLTKRIDSIDAGFLSHHHGRGLGGEDVANLKAFLQSI